MPEFPNGGVLWDQYNNPATEPPLGIGSQKFEPATYSTSTIRLLTTSSWPLRRLSTSITSLAVRVMGEYSQGGGPASSFNVYFYSNDAGNLPGALIAAYLNRPYTGTPPDFTINLTTTPSPSLREPIGSRCKPGRISIQMVSGSGTTGPFKRTRALPGKTRVTATGPAASLGTERTPACPTRYGPTRFSKSSALLRALRLLQLQHRHRALVQRLPHATPDSDLMFPFSRLRQRNSASASSRLDCRERNRP